VLLYLVQNNKNVFYVDIGAYNPTFASNFRSLYDFGNRGINVEASQDRFKDVIMGRPGDINLRYAVSNITGDVVTLYNLLEDSSSSTIMKNAKDKDTLVADGTVYHKELVPTLTLSDLCDRYYVTKPTVLNVDVEGADYLVMKGNSWNTSVCRPDIIIVEDNHFSIAAGYDAIIPFIEDKNYTYFAHTYQDNKFLIDNNVLDNYVELLPSNLEKLVENMGEFMKGKKVLTYLYFIHDYTAYIEYTTGKRFPIDKNNFAIAPLNNEIADKIIIDLEELSNKPLMLLNFDCQSDIIFWNSPLACEFIAYQHQFMDVTVTDAPPLVTPNKNKQFSYGRDYVKYFDTSHKEKASVVIIDIGSDDNRIYEKMILFDVPKNCAINRGDTISNCIPYPEYAKVSSANYYSFQQDDYRTNVEKHIDKYIPKIKYWTNLVNDVAQEMHKIMDEPEIQFSYEEF
jgi:FkbM family methyltransferase